MRIYHITAHNVFLGGGERLVDSWTANSKFDSIFYAKAGGLNYGNPKFKTYETDEELQRIVLALPPTDVVIIHDPFLSNQEWLSKVRRKLWYVHGAFAFTFNVSSIAKPLFAISNFMPKTTHPSWKDILIAPVHLGVDCLKYMPAKEPRTGRMVAGIVGRVSEEKCPLYFFDFIDKFNREHPDHNFEFHYYGKTVVNSEWDIKFKARAAKTLRFFYKGHVEKDEVAKIYHRFDCLVVPSLSESGSFAILEAQACGLRVFALNADGIPYHMTKHSVLCKDYDEIFARLSRFTRRESATIAPKIRGEMIAEFGLKDWVRKLDALAEVAGFI